MSEHQWCRDTARDKAVRAAEDAAAAPAIQHRDLPEQVALLWASLTDILGRVVRLEGEMDAGEAEAEEAAPPQPDPASPVVGFRTDDLAKVTAERDAALRVARVILEVAWRPEKNLEPPAEWRWQDFVNLSGDPLGPGESVRVVDETEAMKCMTKLRRERDAARAECERLRDRVAELEAAPPEPRGWLTAEERDAVGWIVQFARHHAVPSAAVAHCNIETVDSLLARSSPPRVKVPKELQLVEARGVRIVYDAAAVKKAIREAGGEVEG